MQHGLIEWQKRNKSVPLMRLPQTSAANPSQLEAAGNGLATVTFIE